MNKNQQQSGQVLILVLLMMVFLLTIALTVNQAVIVNAKLASDTVKSGKALSAAEALIEDGLFHIKNNPEWTPVVNPEEFMYAVSDNDIVKVTRKFNNGQEGIRVSLQKGQTIQFQLVPGEYNRLAFFWSEEQYPPIANPTAYVYPQIDVQYAGMARYDSAEAPQSTVGPTTPGILLQDYGHVLFSEDPNPNREFQFSQEIRTDTLPATEATPYLDKNRNYVMRVKPFRLGTNNTLYIVPLNAADQVVPNVIKGFVGITAIGEYPPNSDRSTQKAVRVSFQLPQETLLDIFDYGVYVEDKDSSLRK